MNTLVLTKPTMEHKEMVWDYRMEHSTHGEAAADGTSMLDQAETYEAWLDGLINLPEGWVPGTSFLGIRKADNKLVGMINIRHELNEALRNYGGNIGYGVRPTERRKGYATEMLALALDFCRAELGLDKVLVSCSKTNTGSRRTIEKNGGVLEREYLHKDGYMEQLFWITL